MSLQRSFRPSLVSRVFMARPAFARVPARFASGDYGSGEGHPAGENPQEQGKNPMEKMEHPGPPPPDTSKHGGGGGASKGGQQPLSSGSGSASGGSNSSSTSSKGTSGAEPKILSDSPPEEGAQSEEVAKHNREMDQRAEQAHEKVRSHEDVKNDKVGKGYWKAPDEHQHNPVKT